MLLFTEVRGSGILRTSHVSGSATFACSALAPGVVNLYAQAPREGAKNMVDRGRARDVNEAAARFAETLAESYRLVYAQAAESVEAYALFLNPPFPRSQAAPGGAAGTAAGVVGAATGAVADATAEGAQRTAKTAAFPIAGYDEMNVEEVSERLKDLSVEELQLVRDYEERNKRRETLLEQMDRKIRAT